MKLSFSTLGCPGWSFDEIIAAAGDLGYDGVEIRGVGRELYAPKAKPFLAANIQSTMDKLKNKGIEISCLTSGALLNESDDTEKQFEEATDYIDLASAVGVRYVRVLGDANPHPGTVDINTVAASLKMLADYAVTKNVIVLVETNGIFADSEVMGSLIKKVGSEGLGVLWDIHHTYRYFNEKPEDTYNNIGKYIKHIHVKDSKLEDGKIVYKMSGYGDIPIYEALKVLKKNNYSGYVSLEWVKRWCLELEEPGIVFAHFINYMN